MRAKDNTHHYHRSSVNNLLLATIILSLLVFHAWNAQPVNAITGAVEDGLVAYWSFNKDTVKIKTEAADVLSGLVAEVHGDPELAPASDCKVGECILFDGDVDYFLVEDSDPPKIDRDWDEITLECWVYINALDDSWNRIISLDDMPANTAVASLYYDDDDNQHGFFIRAGGQSTQAAKDNVLEDIPIEEWLHLAGTYDGSTVHYYVNGKQEKRYAMNGGKISKGGLLLGIGDRSDGCNCDTIQGYIDEFRIYDRVLSAAEIQKNMDATR
ncbi:LamG domain-containing protein, partial [Candidatus Poribacteria bacterium]|nr:LamG domain-containing protein [Candidatus Poribacteria bacterium]